MSQPKVVIRQAVILIGLLLAVATSIAAQSNPKPWLRGVWEGTGYQNDDNSTWAMKVTVKRLKSGRRTFSIDYPSLECGGRWKLLSMSQTRATFREILDHGQDKCSDKGQVTIQRFGRQLIFLYANEGSREITASAVLNRKMTGRRAQTLHCPPSSLSCSKSDEREGQYLCHVDAPRIPDYDPPAFKWSLTAGRVVDDSGGRNNIIDVSEVDAEVVTVMVEVKLPLPGCTSVVSSNLKLR